MKKFLALIMALAIVGGCCSTTVNGVTTKNFTNCVAKVPFINSVKTALCPPNADQVAQAAAAANFLTSIFLKTDYTAQIATAVQVFLDVANKICIGLDQLQTAVNTFDEAAAVVQTKIAGKASFTVAIPDISALRQAAARK